jgi:hypothetical protein
MSIAKVRGISVAAPYLLTISKEYGRKVPFQECVFRKIQAHRIFSAAEWMTCLHTFEEVYAC